MNVKTASAAARLRLRLAAAVRERKMFAQSLAEANARFAEKVKELSLLRRIGDSISNNLDERAVCESLVNIITSEMTAENCSVMLLTEDGGHLMLRAAQGQTDSAPRFFDAADPKAPRIPIGNGVAGTVAKTGKPMLVQNTAEDRHFKKIPGRMKNISSLLCTPIAGEKGSVIGVLNLSHPDIGQFSRENERLLRLIVNHAALAFNNIRLFSRIHKFNEGLEQAVTERTKELRNSEGKYRALMQQGSEGIVIAGRDGVIRECNAAAGILTGQKPSAWAGRHLDAMMPDAAPTILKRLGGNTPPGRAPVAVEAVLRAGRGKRGAAVSIGANLIALVAGPVIHITMRDITQRTLLDEKLRNYSRNLEEEVRRRTRELKAAQNELIQAAKLAALGELASGVAHEINNPIAIIAGYAEDLKDRVLKGESPGMTTLMRTLDLISESAQRAHAITQEILDFSTPRATRIAVHNIQELLETSVAMVRPRLKNMGLSVTTRGNALAGKIRTDKNHVVQVMINLLNNAADASRENGIITITANIRGGLLAITVTDNGGGIPKELMGKIFDPFFTTKEPGKGTGLGLSISYRIVQKLGGRLTAASRPGKTAFTVQLPLEAETAAVEHKGAEAHD